jgi:hypothetical protein
LDYRLEIRANGLKEDLKALWDGLLPKGASNGPRKFGDGVIELEMDIRAYDGNEEAAEGGISHIPGTSGFDALFREHQRISFFIAVTGRITGEAAWWTGINGARNEHERFRDAYADGIDGRISGHRSRWRFRRGLGPQTLRCKETALACLRSYYSYREDGIPKEHKAAMEIIRDTRFGRETALEFADLNDAAKTDGLETRELCLAAVRQYGPALKYVPEALKSDGPEAHELCLAAVRQNGWALQWVPEELRTNGPGAVELCLTAVRQDGAALEFVPEDMKTGTHGAELCLTAVRQSGWALKFVPENMKTNGPAARELCLEAVKNYGGAQDDSSPLDYVPEAAKTAELCLEAARQDGRSLEFVPEALKTNGQAAFELCLTAVKQNGWALQFVPEDVRTNGPGAFELCLEAVKQSGAALEYVPEALKADEPAFIELCHAAVRQDGWAIGYVPEAMRMQEPPAVKLWIAAAKHNWRFFLDYVPEAVKTEEFWLEAVKQSAAALNYAPEALRPRIEEEIRRRGLLHKIAEIMID